VTWDKWVNKWRAKLKFNDKYYHVGLYTDEVEAAKARDKTALKLFGPIAALNF